MRDLVPGDATDVDLYVGQVEAGVNRGGPGLQLVILVGGVHHVANRRRRDAVVKLRVVKRATELQDCNPGKTMRKNAGLRVKIASRWVSIFSSRRKTLKLP
jgi:hypothetical protein